MECNGWSTASCSLGVKLNSFSLSNRTVAFLSFLLIHMMQEAAGLLVFSQYLVWPPFQKVWTPLLLEVSVKRFQVLTHNISSSFYCVLFTHIFCVIILLVLKFSPLVFMDLYFLAVLSM